MDAARRREKMARKMQKAPNVSRISNQAVIVGISKFCSKYRLMTIIMFNVHKVRHNNKNVHYSFIVVLIIT